MIKKKLEIKQVAEDLRLCKWAVLMPFSIVLYELCKAGLRAKGLSVWLPPLMLGYLSWVFFHMGYLYRSQQDLSTKKEKTKWLPRDLT